MSDRSSKPSFAVSTNLKNTKYHCIEAKIDEQNPVIPHQTLFQHQLGYAYHLTWKALVAKRGKRHFYFWNFSKYKTWREKVGDIAYYIHPIWKSGGTRPPCPQPNCAHAPNTDAKTPTHSSSSTFYKPFSNFFSSSTHSITPDVKLGTDPRQ